jgi:hypothetical protein
MKVSTDDRWSRAQHFGAARLVLVVFGVQRG